LFKEEDLPPPDARLYQELETRSQSGGKIDPVLLVNLQELNLNSKTSSEVGQLQLGLQNHLPDILTQFLKFDKSKSGIVPID
jgi:hypothetical protein